MASSIFMFDPAKWVVSEDEGPANGIEAKIRSHAEWFKRQEESFYLSREPSVLIEQEFRGNVAAETQRANALADKCQSLQDELTRMTKERDSLELRMRRMGGK